MKSLDRGFTLVELAIALAIAGTALAVAVPGLGSWINEQDRWMEGDPRVVTGYALMALSHCKPKK